MTDREEIRLPVRLFRVPESRRDDFPHILAFASEIWAQAAIQLELSGEIITRQPVTLDLVDYLLGSEEGGSIAGYAVRVIPNGPNGANGRARFDTKRFVIADHTEVPPERVLAHELGHILIVRPPWPIDLTGHWTKDPKHLMATGERGTHLIDPEIQRARKTALALSAELK